MQVENFFAAGSPAPVFVIAGGHAQVEQGWASVTFSSEMYCIVTGKDSEWDMCAPCAMLPVDYHPKAAHYFNIMHPSDPVAYRFEPLSCGSGTNKEPQLLPHYSSGTEKQFADFG